MKAVIAIFVIFAALVSAQTTGSQPICVKYAAALNISQLTLMTNIIDGVFGALTTNGSNTLPFFNGQTPPGSINFVNNASNLNYLANLLIEFFGGALGCNEEGFPTYTGNPNMTVVHAKMPITTAVFNQFVTDVISVLNSAQVSQADQTTVQNLLNSFKSQICNQSDCNPASGDYVFAPLVALVALFIGLLV